MLEMKDRPGFDGPVALAVWKAQSSSFAPQAKRGEPPLTSRFVTLLSSVVPQVPLSCGPHRGPPRC
jgi:hypothetical protein